MSPHISLAMVISILATMLGCGASALRAPERGRIEKAETELIGESGIARREELRITDADGKVHEFYLRSPRAVDRPQPAVFLLAGFETGKAALDLLAEREDLFLLSMDYPFQGSKDFRGLGSLWALPALRRMGFETVDAGTLALDYLSQHPAVDREKLVLLGVSFGSVFATASGALDERARAIVLIYGGGDVPALVDNAIRSSWLPSWLIRLSARLFFGVFEPLDHIRKISPRYLLMINSRQDELVRPPLAMALYERASDPKKLIWYETGHMDLFDPGLIGQLTGQVVDELRGAGYLAPHERRERRQRPGGADHDRHGRACRLRHTPVR
jgi:fermentation-respiration switch protein FrsA (DUF1100 family)